MKKESFVFYETWAEAIRQMPDKERLQVFDAIMAYGIYGTKTDLGGLAQLAINMIYNNIDDMKAKRQERAEKNRQNVLQRWQNNTNVYNRIQSNTNDTNGYELYHNVNVNVNGNVNGNGNVKKDIEVSNSIESNKDKKNKESVGKTRKRFIPPTLEELTEFCRERNSTVNPERFMAYYESNGWKVGRNGMKNWQQSVISWECRDREEGKIAPTPTESVRIETDEQGRRFAIWPDGTKARLGEGEFIQGGERRYRKDGPIVPRDADPRPDTTCFFNRETNKWSNA